MFFPKGFNLTLSTQKIKPDNVTVMMYDAGAYWQSHGLHIEAEYLYKHYADNAFKAVHAFDSFASYDIPTRKGIVKYVTPLVRYDYMSDHSDGKRYLNGKADKAGQLTANDSQRSRLTGGVTLSMKKPFVSDIRFNYEKYFYRKGGTPHTSEKDKIVVEFMTRF